MSKMKVIVMVVMVTIVFLYLSACGNGKAKDGQEQKSDSTQVAGGSDSTKNAGNADSTKGTDKKDGKPDDKKKEDLVPVEVTTIKRGVISNYILLSANLETEKMADVYPRIQGIVERVLVDEGDFVKKGQVLLELEADEYKLAEERARLNYMRQKSEFDRMESMYKENLLSIEEFDRAKYTTQGLEVEWKQAQLNLSYTRIISPINGIIGDRFKKPGERLQSMDKVFTVVNTDEMIAVVYAPEKELGNVQKNQFCYITSDNIPGTRFTGKIKRVSPMVDPQSGTFKVTIGVRNEQNRLRVGIFVNTHIITDTHENAVLIPKTALVYENEQMNVFVVRDSLAHKIILKVGFQDHEKVEALSDIEAGDKVIVVGQAGLKDKTRVKIVSERENLLAMRSKEEILY
jgi:membrane fusion protein (multidrug efflux system)